MKEKILFVNSCVRGDNESRTLALAKTALNRLDGDIEEIRLADANLKPLDAAGLAKRAESAEKNDFSDPVYEYIKTVTKSFFGIENFSFCSAEGLDILGNDPAAILKAAQEKIEREL